MIKILNSSSMVYIRCLIITWSSNLFRSFIHQQANPNRKHIGNTYTICIDLRCCLMNLRRLIYLQIQHPLNTLFIMTALKVYTFKNLVISLNTSWICQSFPPIFLFVFFFSSWYTLSLLEKPRMISKRLLLKYFFLDCFTLKKMKIAFLV